MADNAESTKMETKLRYVLLMTVDSLLFFAIFTVLPFAWILRDGLGPDSVSSAGLAAISRTFMTFYVGPAILLLVSADVLIRGRGGADNSLVSRKAFIIPVILILILTAVGAVAFRLASGH